MSITSVLPDSRLQNGLLKSLADSIGRPNLAQILEEMDERILWSQLRERFRSWRQTLLTESRMQLSSVLEDKQAHMRERYGREKRKPTTKLATTMLKDQGLKMCDDCIRGVHEVCSGDCTCVCWELQ